MFRFAYFFFIFQINVDENLKMKLDLIQIERFLAVWFENWKHKTEKYYGIEILG